MPSGVLEVLLVGATGIKDTEIFGKGDPYCVLSCGRSHARSNTALDQGSKPVWNQKFTLGVDETTSEFVIKIFNKNVLVDDELGCCIIPLSKVFNSGNKIPTTSFSVIRPSGRTQGEVKLSILFVPKNMGGPPPHGSGTGTGLTAYGQGAPGPHSAQPYPGGHLNSNVPTYPAGSPPQSSYPPGPYSAQHGYVAAPPAGYPPSSDPYGEVTNPDPYRSQSGHGSAGPYSSHSNYGAPAPSGDPYAKPKKEKDQYGSTAYPPISDPYGVQPGYGAPAPSGNPYAIPKKEKEQYGSAAYPPTSDPYGAQSGYGGAAPNDPYKTKQDSGAPSGYPPATVPYGAQPGYGGAAPNDPYKTNHDSAAPSGYPPPTVPYGPRPGYGVSTPPHVPYPPTGDQYGNASKLDSYGSQPSYGAPPSPAGSCPQAPPYGTPQPDSYGRVGAPTGYPPASYEAQPSGYAPANPNDPYSAKLASYGPSYVVSAAAAGISALGLGNSSGKPGKPDKTGAGSAYGVQTQGYPPAGYPQQGPG